MGKINFSIKEIKKTNLEDTFFGMYFYRKSATYFTFFLARTNLTPNKISMLSLLFALFGSFLLILGKYNYSVLGVILIQVGMILDYSDGQIARLKKLGTKRGAWLDVLFGMIQNNILILCVILGLINQNFPYIEVLLLGFIVLFAWNMTCYVHLNTMLFFPNYELKKSKSASLFSRYGIRPQFLSIGSDVYFVVIGLSIILNLPFIGLLIMALLGNLYWVSLLVFIFIVKKNEK